MNIRISGIDHSVASVSERESYAVSKKMRAELLRGLKDTPGILGAVILATCNRTEVYVSAEDGVEFEPFSVLGGRPDNAYTCTDRDAFCHLVTLAAGLKSRLFAEDQIISQVKEAIECSRELRAADSELEVFFREAVSAAKRIKTQFHFSHGDVSAAAAVKDLLLGRGDVKDVLVIGNGEIGRTAAAALCRAGFGVTMTLRQYRHSSADIPAGVATVDYTGRYGVMDRCQAVVSATASPHYTVAPEGLRGVSPLPALFIDLAMPRDIDPLIADIYGVTVLNLDDVADTAARDELRSDAVESVLPVIDGAWADFLSWRSGREHASRQPQHSHFPLFIDSTGRKAVVVGGGRIATRRVLSLSKFKFDILVVAPEISDELRRLEQAGRITVCSREFEDCDLDGAFIALAATDVREVNRRVASLARHRGIPASIADRRDECSFYFPGIAEDDRVVVGVIGDGASHHETARLTKRIRETLRDDN